MKSLKEQIAIMMACDTGLRIQYCVKGTEEWEPVRGTPPWNWSNYDYRIEPRWVPEVGQKVITKDPDADRYIIFKWHQDDIRNLELEPGDYEELAPYTGQSVDLGD